jgi:hypothetical protein
MARLQILAATTALLLCRVSTPAWAEGYYNDQCASRQGPDVWSLSLSVTGDYAAQLWREDRSRVRTGTYEQNGDDVVAHLEDITLHLHVASGDAEWRAGDARGTFTCRYVGDAKPVRWIDAPAVASIPGDGDDMFAPGTWADAPATPTPKRTPDGKLCDMQEVCYPMGNSPSAPTPTSSAPSVPRADTGSRGTSHVPITLDGDSAMVAIRIGGLTFQALIDTGATSMSLPETAVEELLNSGDAVAGETINVHTADGKPLKRRSTIVNSVTLGNPIVGGVTAVVIGTT